MENKENDITYETIFERIKKRREELGITEHMILLNKKPKYIQKKQDRKYIISQTGVMLR